MYKILRKISSIVLVSLIVILSCSCSLQGEKLDNNKPDTGVEQNEDEDKNKEITGPVKGGTLKLQALDYSSLNPLTTKSRSNSEVFNLIFESLIKYDEEFKPVPFLAKDWKVSDDGMTWTFYLREGIKWHDGEKFTSEDVKFTFEFLTYKNSDSIYKFNIQHLSYFEAPDKYTFKVVLEQPYANFISLMNFPIIPKHQFKGNISAVLNEDYKPIGTGLYKFVENVPHKEIKLASNESWWGDQVPYIDNIVVNLVPDEKTALSSLEVGEIDYVPTNVVDWDKYVGKGNLGIKEYTTNYYEFMGVNFNNLILSDKSVRKAIAYGIDRETIIKDVLLGKAMISDVPINPKSWLYNDSLDTYKYDVDKAKTILSDGGWSDSDGDGVLDKLINNKLTPLSFELVTNSDNIIRQKEAQMIVEQLNNIGMKVNLKNVGWDELNKIVTDKNFDMILTGLYLSPSADLAFAFHSNEIQKGMNFISYNNPQMNDLISQTFKTVNAESRKQVYNNLQSLIVEDLPYISLFFRTSAVVYNKRVEGNVNPTDMNLYNNINNLYLVDDATTE